MPIYVDYGYSHGDYYDDDSSEDDGNSFIDCTHCDAQVLRRNYGRHLNNVHKCSYCDNYMPKNALDAHIQRKHTVTCKYCPAEMLVDEIEQHESTHYTKCKFCSCNIVGDINLHHRQSHPMEATVGMIQLQKVTDDYFNTLIAQNRIYSKNGHIFIKY